jgi:alcohol dehydrogenase class IV
MSNIFYITQIQIESGAIASLKEECLKYGITKPLIVTDQGIRQAGILDKALHALHSTEFVVFDETPSNPTEAAVTRAAQICTAQGCNGIVALGGGSSIDCAKGVAILATHGGELKTFATIEGGSALITDRVLPIIAVPTTAGTGSEVARGAIIIVNDGRKLGFHSWHLVPKLALLDPELTIGLPALLTAATGMDAIAHCMETFMAPVFNPPADGIALEGLTRGWANLAKATQNPRDLDARINMMCASMMGAMAFQKGLGCVHSLSHSLGGLNPRLHHGTLNAVFLPAVIEFNSSAPSLEQENKLIKMAHCMGIQASNHLDALHKINAALKEMNAQLGLPKGLKDMGVEEHLFEKIIDGAVADHCHKTNPKLASRVDYHHMLTASM